jgi:hypothetical protein
MRLAATHPNFQDVGGPAPQQICAGDTIRFRTVTGICNDIYNPLMGSTHQLFARNAQFDTTFPDLGRTEYTRNRHGDRLGLLKPDPQVISRELFTRTQTHPESCRGGAGDGTGQPGCQYQKAPFFNVLAAFWIQFMTHDWFSHLEEGHNQASWMAVGCERQLVNNVEQPLRESDIKRLGCRPGDQIDRAYVAEDTEPATFTHEGKKPYLTRAPKTMRNNVTAWWDASQIYGYDDISRKRVKRDPKAPAKLYLEQGKDGGYLPVFTPNDPIHPDWSGQEATAFPDNWSIGLSFYHNLFAREHNAFVEAFQKQPGDADSGLRHPAKPGQIIRYKDVTDGELFEIARLVVSAEIAKIHTTEWTTQLLYGEPLYKGMNANWHGLMREDSDVSDAVKEVVRRLDDSDDPRKSNGLYAALAGGPGIFGLGNRVYEEQGVLSLLLFDKKDVWSLTRPEHVNGGVKHFGSPFNFPEEFITVYRLHPLLPDMIEYREWNDDPNAVKARVPVVETFRGKATDAMRRKGLANWTLSMGRQRLGLLTLQNHPQFLQNLTMSRLQSATKQIDVAALDLIRDRERGIPRFNEFRRQYGLKQLTGFEDFVDQRLSRDSPERRTQEELVKLLREVYGQHRCDASKIITDAQVNDDKSPINDCLGHPDGSLVDNIEDVDTVVGWLAEFRRPHGFAISETQFLVFVLNASRRLFSDRFFTSSFRPEFYTRFGVDWVTNNGPEVQMEKTLSNGHLDPVSPMKRVLLRTMPELSAELDHVVNVFDPWARDRGEYYSLQWKPRPGAETDKAFAER